MPSRLLAQDLSPSRKIHPRYDIINHEQLPIELFTGLSTQLAKAEPADAKAEPADAKWIGFNEWL